eukprot:scaffold780_cov99-Isochrysis_galbana.AAC.7
MLAAKLLLLAACVAALPIPGRELRGGGSRRRKGDGIGASVDFESAVPDAAPAPTPAGAVQVVAVPPPGIADAVGGPSAVGTAVAEAVAPPEELAPPIAVEAPAIVGPAPLPLEAAEAEATAVAVPISGAEHGAAAPLAHVMTVPTEMAPPLAAAAVEAIAPPQAIAAPMAA